MHEDSTKIWRTLVKLALLGTTGYMTWQALTRLIVGVLFLCRQKTG